MGWDAGIGYGGCDFGAVGFWSLGRSKLLLVFGLGCGLFFGFVADCLVFVVERVERVERVDSLR